MSGIGFLEAVSEAYDGDIVMIDSTCVRVHQHAATGKGDGDDGGMDVPVAGSRAKFHALVDAEGRPVNRERDEQPTFSLLIETREISSSSTGWNGMG